MLLDEGKKKREARGKMISFRLPASDDASLRQLAKTMGGITPTIAAAVSFLAGVKGQLQNDRARLQRFMLDKGLNPMTQEAEGVVLAVREALDEADRRRK